MTRHQPWFVYVPSAITVWCFTLHGGMAGRMFRRHAVRLRRALESSFAPHADREARRVVPEFLRTLVFARPRGDDQFADCTFSPSLDMSR